MHHKSGLNKQQYCQMQGWISFFLVLFFITTSFSACLTHQWDDSGVCKPCHLSCLQCSGGDSNSNCTSCTGSFLKNKACLSTCGSGYIDNISNNKCQQCTNNCATCSIIKQNCTSCSGSRVLFQTNSSCLSACPSYYKNSSGVCTIIFCSTECANCVDIFPNNCSSCFSMFTYFPLVKNCVPNNTYDVALSTGYQRQNTDNPKTPYDCGIYQNLLGKYTPTQTFTIFTLTNMRPHAAFRLMVWVLWIDNWVEGTGTSGSLINFTNSDFSKIYATANYTNASNRQQDYCGQTTMQRLSIVDSRPSHSSDSLTVKVRTNNNCPDASKCGWAYKEVLVFLLPCHQYCKVCSGTAKSSCSECSTNSDGFTYLKSGSTCEQYCLERYYFKLPWNCSACIDPCYSCQDNGNNCTKCISGHVFFPLNNTCPEECYEGYYFNNDTNQCQPCYYLCKKCTGFPSPCQQCETDIYFMPYNNTCWQLCPSTFHQLDPLWLCLKDDDFYVNLNILFQFDDNYSSLTVIMNFTQPLNFSTFPYQTFQTILIQDTSVTIDKFHVQYELVNQSAYTIKLSPVGIIFMKKTPIIVKTIKSQKFSLFSKYDNPLSQNTYDYKNQTFWTIIYPPNLTETQTKITATFSKGSSGINTFFSNKILQDFKSMGLFLLIFNYLQIPAMLMLLNVIYPVNFYDGTRTLASLVLYNVPSYESQTPTKRYIFNQQHSFQGSKRLLQEENLITQYNFYRTSFLNNFLLDCYGNLILLMTALILNCGVFFVHKYSKKFQNRSKIQKIRSFFYSFLHRVNQVILFFFTLSIVLEVQYFEITGFKVLSAVMCVFGNGYLLIYQIWMYYELHGYLLLKNSISDEIFVKYGSFLRWVKYQQRDTKKFLRSCPVLQKFFQPYNYHILSYLKKFLMLISICLFYNYPLCQIGMLITIQSLQLVRFVITMPYQSKWRNVIHLLLQITLLMLFFFVLGMTLVLGKIHTSTDLPLNYTMGTVWIRLGWVSFTLLLIFCLGHLTVDVIGIVYGVLYTNKQLIDKNKKQFYYGKIVNYQQNNVEAPLELKDQFQKYQLEEKSFVQSNEINVMCEEIVMNQLGLLTYEVEINKPIVFKMGRFSTMTPKKCNIRVQQKLQRKLMVIRNRDPILFHFIDSNFHAMKLDDGVCKVRVKTFVEIDQRSYKGGQQIQVGGEMKFSHEVVLYGLSEAERVINFESKLANFPIQFNELKRMFYHK